MEKRLPLALFLSFLVLFGWTLLNPPPEPSPEDVETTQPVVGEETPTQANPTSLPEAPRADVSATEEKELELEFGRAGEPGHYRAIFSNRGARLVELDLGDYYTVVGLSEAEKREQRYWLPLLEPVETLDGPTGSLLLKTLPSSRGEAPQDLDTVLWQMEKLNGAEPGVRFTYGPGTGVVFSKEIRAVPGSWQLRVRLGIENRSRTETGRRDFLFRPAGCVPPELAERFYPEPQAAAVGWDEDDDEYTIDKQDAPGAGAREAFDVPLPLISVGVHNKYFALFVREIERAQSSFVGATHQAIEPVEPVMVEGTKHSFVAADVVLALHVPAQGQTSTKEYIVYAGPKAPAAFVSDHESHAAVLDEDLSGFAIFSSIGKLLLRVLGFFHGLVGNWGVAIILLTVCVRAVLFPLNRRSQTSMARYQKKMKRVQPRIDEAKKRYASDPQKLREAQAKIMQEEGAFPPLGGCLPIFVQLPIFFGLFAALRTSFDLRQAPFAGWINDLSRPDRLMELGMEIPLLITTLDLRYLNLLPLLMVVLWIGQQAGMPKPADEQAARMQKMMMFMPIIFCFLLYNYAAGLSLYMITGSALGIIEQRVIKKVWPIDDTEPENAKRKGCGPFSGMMENLAEKQKEQLKRMEEMKRLQEAQRGRTNKGRKKRR